jgi:hypothetical protein
VRLKGPAGNPIGVGATLQLVSSNGNSALREVKVGSGYWSQGSSVQIVTGPAPDRRLKVRWPWGKEHVVSLPDGANEVVVDENGGIKATR